MPRARAMPSPGGQVSEMVGRADRCPQSGGVLAGVRAISSTSPRAITRRPEGKPGMIRSGLATGCPPAGA